MIDDVLPPADLPSLLGFLNYYIQINLHPLIIYKQASEWAVAMIHAYGKRKSSGGLKKIVINYLPAGK